MKEKIQTLSSLLDKLGPSDKKFAADLIYSFSKYQKLTEKQSPWIDKLIQKALNPAPKVELPKLNVGGFQEVVGLFKTAQMHLKYPKITLECMGKKVLLSVAGPTSTNPGSINVMGEGKYPDREWFGRVSPEGIWIPSKQLMAQTNLLDAMQELLVEFGADPAGVAKKYGKLTGNCCFCGSQLSDDHSTAAGFGPVCAEHYGLKAQWKAAVDKADKEGQTVFVALKEAEKKVDAAVGQMTFDTLFGDAPTACFLCGERPGVTKIENYLICKECSQEMGK